jgi:hypothetical protein
MSRRPYDEMARELGLDLCRGCPDYDHAGGEAGAGRVHYDALTSSWPATKRFLKLCAYARDPALRDTGPLWAHVYLTNMASREIGRRLGIRVPSRYLTLDRIVVLAGVAGLSNDVPMRKQAYDWARR